MTEHKGSETPAGIAIDSRVRVYPGTDRETHGIIADDFGDTAGISVDVGGDRFVGPARRWAVTLDDGNLAFVDGDQVVAE